MIDIRWAQRPVMTLDGTGSSHSDKWTSFLDFIAVSDTNKRISCYQQFSKNISIFFLKCEHQILLLFISVSLAQFSAAFQDTSGDARSPKSKPLRFTGQVLLQVECPSSNAPHVAQKTVSNHQRGIKSLEGKSQQSKRNKKTDTDPVFGDTSLVAE